MSEHENEPKWGPADSEDNYWPVNNAKVGRAIGMTMKDDRMSTVVLMELWVPDLGKSAKFIMKAKDAEALGLGLVDSAEKARAEGALE